MGEKVENKLFESESFFIIAHNLKMKGVEYDENCEKKGIAVRYISCNFWNA